MRTYLAFDASGLPFIGGRTLPLRWAHMRLRAMNNYYCFSLPFALSGSVRYKLQIQDVSQLFESLSDLVGAGIPLSSAIQNISESTTSQAYRYFLGEISYRIHEKGQKLAEALSAYPEFFSNHVCAIIHLSEQTGNYAKGFKAVADLLNAQIARNKTLCTIRNQLYLILMFAVISFLSLLILLVPQTKVFFAQNNIPISTMTGGVIWLSDSLYQVTLGDVLWCAFLCVCVLFCVRSLLIEGVLSAKIHATIRMKISRLIMVFPLVKAYTRCTFWFFTHTLMQAGVSFAEALKLCAENSHASIISRESQKILAGITCGDEITGTLRESVFSSLLNKQLLPTIAISDDTKKVVKNIYTLEIRYFEKRIQDIQQRLYPLGLSLITLGVLGMIYVIFVPIYQSVGGLL